MKTDEQSIPCPTPAVGLKRRKGQRKTTFRRYWIKDSRESKNYFLPNVLPSIVAGVFERLLVFFGVAIFAVMGLFATRHQRVRFNFRLFL